MSLKKIGGKVFDDILGIDPSGKGLVGSIKDNPKTAALLGSLFIPGVGSGNYRWFRRSRFCHRKRFRNYRFCFRKRFRCIRAGLGGQAALGAVGGLSGLGGLLGGVAPYC